MKQERRNDENISFDSSLIEDCFIELGNAVDENPNITTQEAIEIFKKLMITAINNDNVRNSRELPQNRDN